MKFLSGSFIIIFLLHLSLATSSAQEYLWPTNASQYLTSSFAEYRPGHLHAGIDIKTWGQVGYPVYAIRDGYIMRIMVSPFGYGKVLYQKLDTGEIVVYAHLDRFNEPLDTFAREEQKRRQSYRINVSLNPNQFSVRKGDIIGYTGETGIGSPHLHFEIRDRNNDPINPFLLGYKILDTIPPKVTAISITPLDAYSRVNSDVLPWLEKPIQDSQGIYRLFAIPLVSGKIGFAIDCFDRADGVDNTFAVYKLDFYVDGALQFSATYNKFSYDVSHLIDWDRDFRLMSRGKGIFQKLYKEKWNELDFYKPIGSEIGMLRCDPDFLPDSQPIDRLAAGLHQFSIELYDFFGNVATVEGNFIVGKRTKIAARYQFEAPDRLYISAIQDDDGRQISNPELFASVNSGQTWRQAVLHPNPSKPDSLLPQDQSYLLKPIRPYTMIKLQAPDEATNFRFPSFYCVIPDSLVADSAVELRIEKDFYDDYVRLQLYVKGMIQHSPELMVQQIGMAPVPITLWQTDFNKFVGCYVLIPGKNGPLSIEAKVKNFAGREFSYWEQLHIQTITPQQGGMIASKDRNCRITFSAGSVYKNVFLRLDMIEPVIEAKYNVVSNSYEIFPQDIPLKKSGRIELHYPASDPQPEKLGIYRKTKKGWGFVGNKMDLARMLISSQTANLGIFALIRDVAPPVLSIRYPQPNALLQENKPAIIASVYDELSGIEDERFIIIKLDDRKIIAEYDPEARIIKYIPDEPISPGEHRISVWAMDNCKNEISMTTKFTIIK